VNSDQLVIGVNTDNSNSKGHYCSVRDLSNLDVKIQSILKGNTKIKKYNKLEAYVQGQKKSFNFLNDVYYGEANIGRVSKCELTVDYKTTHKVKSTGIIFSTCKNINFIIR